MRFSVGMARGAVGRGWAVARLNIPLGGGGGGGGSEKLHVEWRYLPGVLLPSECVCPPAHR